MITSTLFRSKYQRDIIIHAMFGHYSPLLQSKVSAKVAELVFNDYATPKQRFEITSEFFGKEFTLFRVIQAYLINQTTSF